MLFLVLYFLASGIRSGDRGQLQRYGAMLLLFLANCLFWALFEQAGSSLNFLARDFVDAPFHFTLFQSANPLFILLLAPLFALLWPALAARWIAATRRNRLSSHGRRRSRSTRRSAAGIFFTISNKPRHHLAPSPRRLGAWGRGKARRHGRAGQVF